MSGTRAQVSESSGTGGQGSESSLDSLAGAELSLDSLAGAAQSLDPLAGGVESLDPLAGAESLAGPSAWSELSSFAQILCPLTLRQGRSRPLPGRTEPGSLPAAGAGSSVAAALVARRRVGLGARRLLGPVARQLERLLTKIGETLHGHPPLHRRVHLSQILLSRVCQSAPVGCRCVADNTTVGSDKQQGTGKT